MTLEVPIQKAVGNLYEKMMASSAVKREDSLFLNFLAKLYDLEREFELIELQETIRHLIKDRGDERKERVKGVLEYLYELLDTSTSKNSWLFPIVAEAIKNGRAFLNFVENR